MTEGIKRAWDEVLGPLLRRPKRLQVAALCYTRTGAQKKVLLITSRDTKRWIVPKGWPIDGLGGAEAAAREAWEEAGVRSSNFGETPVGTFEYEKRLDSGAVTPVNTLTYAVEVDRLEDDYPEAGERERRWVSPEDAADMVDEPGLKHILRQM